MSLEVDALALFGQATLLATFQNLGHFLTSAGHSDVFPSLTGCLAIVGIILFMCDFIVKITWGRQMLMRENLKVVRAKFSTLSLAVFVMSTIDTHIFS